ncbi:MAG: phosphoenolpyruvate synthase regulatory protein [Hyphomicrobiales bacterium]|nr:MAG: phosphoenolpyruvate synthase regulatory protein [Hyphomicrobiales bacterium]
MAQKYFHLHLISDATGETLNAISKSVTVQFPSIQPIEHLYSLVRTPEHMSRVLREIQSAPGIVLFTLVDQELRKHLERSCEAFDIPAIAVLDPALSALRSYLGAESIPKIGGQHRTNESYFKRIEAVTYSLSHDDGNQTDELDDADIVLIGVSRTSKTPTSIYLANRGLKAANVPLVNNIPLPEILFRIENPLIVCLIASVDYLIQIRKTRLSSLNASQESDYIDKSQIISEIRTSREIAAINDWPVIDVTRRSIEETAASILNLYNERHEH